MDIKKDDKIFDTLFILFVDIGQKQLGRKLSANEIKVLKPFIARKCENIKKEDIVREIYNLELAREEKKHGHLSDMKKFKTKAHLALLAGKPMKFSSSSTDLRKAVSRQFANIEISDSVKRNPAILGLSNYYFENEHKNLNLKYNKAFSYRAKYTSDKETSNKIKKIAALGSAFLIASTIGAEVLFGNQTSEVKEETSISDITTAQQPMNERDYLVNSISTPLEHFKDVFTSEYNNLNNSELSSGFIRVRSVPHTYILEATNSEGEVFYVTKGNSPGTTEDLLNKAGYSLKGINYYGDDIDVVSVVTDSGNFIAAYAKTENGIVPICADGTQITNHEPSQEELNSGYSEIINANTVADSQLLADLHRSL